MDFFGERIDLTFEKKAFYKTNFGAIVSIFCFTLMAGFFATRTAKLAADSEPFFSSTSQTQRDAVDLWKLGFMFAISVIPTRIGSVEAYRVRWSDQ